MQPGDAGADDQHLGRRDGAGRRHEQWEEARQMGCRDEGRPVAGHGAHGAERVHWLRSGDPRHAFHCKRGDAPSRQRLQTRRVGGRGKETDEGRAFLQPADLLLRWRRDFQNDIGSGKNVFLEFCACLLVCGIRKASRNAGAGFDDHLQISFAQGRQHLRHERHAPFACGLFARNADDHE